MRHACRSVWVGNFSINDAALRGRGNRRVAPAKPARKRRHCLEGFFRGGMTWCAAVSTPLFRPFRYMPLVHNCSRTTRRNGTRAGRPPRSSHNTISKFFLTLKSNTLTLRHCSWTIHARQARSAVSSMRISRLEIRDKAILMYIYNVPSQGNWIYICIMTSEMHWYMQ